MAKKAKEAEAPVEVAPQVITKKEAIKKQIIEEPKVPIFEFKDRVYVLSGDRHPVVYSMQTKHSQRKPLLILTKKLVTKES